jgi:hypothetical protein
MNLYTPFSVLTDKYLVIVRNNQYYKVPIEDMFTNVGEIIDFAVRNDVYNVWVAPSDTSDICTEAFCIASEHTHNVRSLQLGIDRNHMQYLKGWRLEGTYQERRDVSITIPHVSRVWKMYNKDYTAKDLIYMLQYLHTLIPVPINGNPAYIGIKLLEYTNDKRRANWLEECEVELPANSMVNDLLWKLPYTPIPKIYVHVFDKNGAYLAACQSVDVGTGTPIIDMKPIYNKRVVGVWYGTFTGSSKYNGTELPSAIARGKQWFYTPEIEIALMLGYESFQPEKAIIWETKHRVFNKWVPILRDGKKDLETNPQYTNMVARQLAIDGIKKIYTHMVGRLNRQKTYYNQKDKFLRPDYRAMVVGDNKLKVFYQINKLVGMGYIPFMVNNDALYFLSDERNPMLAIPTIMDRQDKLGGYKHNGTYLWEDIQDAFLAGKGIRKVLSRIKQLDREGKSISCQ